MNLKSFNDTWSIAKRYFIASEHKITALAYFFAVIAMIILMVGFNYALSLSLAAFWASLTTLNIHVFCSSLLVTSAYMFINSILSVSRSSLTEKLITKWRSFLTLDLTNQYLNPEQKAYLFFSRDRDSEMHNVGQNIQVDAHKFTEKTLNLVFDFFGSVLSIFTFMYSLWHVGGNLSLIFLGVHLFIPGYLVIASLLLGLLANFIAYQIGKRLSTLINSRLIEEAKFRTEIEKIHESAECIAQAKSSKYHQTILSSVFANAQTYSFSTLYEKIKLNGFQSFFAGFSKLFPYLLASPLYFSGKLSIGALNQAAYAFTELSRSMAWFQTAVKDIAELTATSARLKKLYDHLDDMPQQSIIHKQAKNQIDFNLALVSKPNGEVLFRNLKLQLKAHENVLIQGPSGLGKSSIFKCLAENWPYADGEILIPEDKSLMFLPQKPFIPADDFKTVLSYPDAPSTHPYESYLKVLHDVGLDSFIPSLNTKGEWASSLSGGQQQRVLFARALLKKPDWLFMDESSSSLDEASEAQLYQTLRQTLLDTTIVSIAHKDTVAKFHDAIIQLLINAHTNEVEEKALRQPAA
ncbi:MAG: ABC transporter ATP-binding protein/permease [Gammaproteobacteria bacterium]|nr:ABC transporter ATP-binding protein/permease [Gammaproteobacteria bacterium]